MLCTLDRTFGTVDGSTIDAGSERITVQSQRSKKITKKESLSRRDCCLHFVDERHFFF